MSLPTITGAFRLIDTPELRFAGSGTPILKVRLAANSRRKNQQTGEWEDADVLFINGTLFGPRAEAVGEANLPKGQEVLVTGRLKTNQWETKEGEKRSATEVLIDTVAPTIRPPRQQASYGQQGGRGAPADDPWANQGFTPANEPAPF
ncbi:single-stranded DNA-binding protein [Klebsiella pneumoniae]|nr:single-stranded DNA-binding protein [Klebsiella pneumoniae]